jgi:hypothetical protein
MKKLLVVILLLGSGSLALAQGISFGIKGGINLSSVTGADATGAEAYTGVAGGGYLTLSLLPSFAVQPEILYSQKGWNASGDLLGVPIVGKYRVDYLEVPVLAKFSFGILVKPYVLVGPYFATRMTSSWEETSGGVTLSGSMDNGLKSSDLGYVLGAGVSTPIKLTFEARYSGGFSTISKSSGTTPDWKNSTISVLVGYALF